MSEPIQGTNTSSDKFVLDKDFMTHVYEGEAEAFDKLYRYVRDLVLSLIRKAPNSINDPLIVEDITQEALVRIWSLLQSKRDTLTAPIILRTTNSVIMDYLRRENHLKEIALFETREEDEDAAPNTLNTLEDTIPILIRIKEEPLTARNFTNVMSALTELHTKYWLIAKGRFADLIEYTQTHNVLMDEEAGLIITKLTHNSPAEIKLNLSLEGVANALGTTIDAIKQADERKREVELKNNLSEAEIEQNKRELDAALADKEQTRQLEKQKALLELYDKQLELKRKQLELVNYVFDLAPKIVDMLYLNADANTKAMAAKTLIKNFIELDTSKGLELALPTPQGEDKIVGENQ